ncbi:hypothetical protein [Mesoterricola silvestris]|uniref:Uncharacterized protein n=1 Tax=Mesoterricola silvestris TaxID=2927979 RepID=A0AA48GZJ6_9BACT|nr:hypothetical protein [Mesoterricola silvestris]BDU73258.1 hypothetical protein METEAL_24320 [Mesoterricola silvestris]
MSADWLGELEKPTAAFFEAFARRAEGPQGPRNAARDAVQNLTSRVDWAAYLPHIPHGLLGLGAAFRLKPLLAEASFLRILSTQLHAFALEARGRGLEALGSGSWANLDMALDTHRPSIAWGEAMAMEAVAPEDFHRLERRVERDMANVGHKAVMARDLGELHLALESPKAGGRALLALAAYLCASEPFDTFWHQRAARRLEGVPPVPHRAPEAEAAAHAQAAREICDAGLVDLLDSFSLRVRAGAGDGDLLAALVLAASEKQLDARRDLEGKTSWNFVYLAHLAKRSAGTGPLAPETWVQGAALVNLFPTDEEEDRPRAVPPRTPAADPATGLLDAILDGEPLQAMFHAGALLEQGNEAAVLGLLAEAASTNDPAFNHSHQILAVAAAADLAPHLPGQVRAAMLTALAKSLANGQGSTDLGRLAQKALDSIHN